MKIREGDPLEIYTNADGEVIFKKYSPVGETQSVKELAEALSKVGGGTAVICDRDAAISQKGEYLTQALENVMENRQTYVRKTTNDKQMLPLEGVDKIAVVAAPIISDGDVNGAVMFLSDGVGETATPEQTSLAKAAAIYLGLRA
jgi:AbrB family transcriptional regulator (stage V sporulation protein T)